MLLFAFGIGWMMGVVVNGLAEAWPEHRPAQWSACRYCGESHRRLGLGSALLALFLARGRCEHCGAPRPLRHWLVELALAAGFSGLWLWAQGSADHFAAAAFLLTIFCLITVIDIEHRLILWRTVWPTAIGLIVIGWLQPERGLTKTLIGGAVGYGVVALLYGFGMVFSWVVARMRGERLTEVAFGSGDVNLAGLVGLAVGWPGVGLALTIAVFAAGLFALGLMLTQILRRRYNPYTPFPYGPFLVLGGLLLYLFGPAVVSWYWR